MKRLKPTLMMPIIQYVMPSRNKQLKKLLHFYWEVCPKYDDNGKLKQEMILVVFVLLLHLSITASAYAFIEVMLFETTSYVNLSVPILRADLLIAATSE